MKELTDSAQPVHRRFDGTPRGQIEELVKSLEETSPIRDTIANPVTVTTRLV